MTESKHTTEGQRFIDRKIKKKLKMSASFLYLTYAGPHVHGSHEAVVTKTAILSGNVGTLTAITDVWSLFTLINI